MVSANQCPRSRRATKTSRPQNVKLFTTAHETVYYNLLSRRRRSANCSRKHFELFTTTSTSRSARSIIGYDIFHGAHTEELMVRNNNKFRRNLRKKTLNYQNYSSRGNANLVLRVIADFCVRESLSPVANTNSPRRLDFPRRKSLQ